MNEWIHWISDFGKSDEQDSRIEIRGKTPSHKVRHIWYVHVQSHAWGAHVHVECHSVWPDHTCNSQCVMIRRPRIIVTLHTCDSCFFLNVDIKQKQCRNAFLESADLKMPLKGRIHFDCWVKLEHEVELWQEWVKKRIYILHSKALSIYSPSGL